MKTIMFKKNGEIKKKRVFNFRVDNTVNELLNNNFELLGVFG